MLIYERDPTSTRGTTSATAPFAAVPDADGRLRSVIDDELSRAVVSFLGSPRALDSTEPERRVLVLLGDRAFDVVQGIQAMLADLDAATPPFAPSHPRAAPRTTSARETTATVPATTRGRRSRGCAFAVAVGA